MVRIKSFNICIEHNIIYFLILLHMSIHFRMNYHKWKQILWFQLVLDVLIFKRIQQKYFDI